MTQIHYINNEFLDFERVEEIIVNGYSLALDPAAIQRIERCRNYLDLKMDAASEPIYGVNTGFGSLCEIRISNEDLSRLQKNLVMSHACGTGRPIAPDLVKLMLLLKIQSLAYGHSGVQVVTVQRLVDFFNHNVLPVVYEYGSLGASGDLAPLAHLSLPLIGLGEVWIQNKIVPTSKVYSEKGWKPIGLQSKEGLALLNGTQFMSAIGVFSCLKAFRLSRLADIIAAISLDAFDGRLDPFHEHIQLIRPHKGQIKTASRINNLLHGSEIAGRPKPHVQDPYSFRCIPQVHGATKDSLNFVANVFRVEINSVTDNPTIFPDENLIISAGNFHGQPLALAFDNLCIAMAELGSISERRTTQLLAGKRGLPPFLIANSGLNSGFMIPQYTAASLVSRNKQLCTPSSVDSIESSQGQEDHVSMGANAATKTLQVLDNLRRILAIELFAAAQAIDFRRPLRTSPVLEDFLAHYRKQVSFVHHDRIMYEDIETTIGFLEDVPIELPEEDVMKYSL